MCVPNTIILAEKEAEMERQRLLADGRELSLIIHRRDAWGVDINKAVSFGRSGTSTWVVVQDLTFPEYIGIEIAGCDQAQELFSVHVERIMTAKMLTNSDPLSPERCDIHPSIEDFVAALKTEFGIEVSPWG
jgi:hypothetical protein